MVDAVGAVVASGRLIGGPELRRFEASFATYCNTGFAVGTGNGLQALTLTLRAAGIGSGDEVILPANSFIATALAVIEAGASPILVDVELETGLISPAAVAEAVTGRTRAIIAVHLYGHPADIFLLEDSCQAHGARYKGRRCGSLGDAAAFSFYPTKNLGGLGDGGAVTTADTGLADRVRLLGNYGAEAKHHHIELGTNSRLDPVQATALSVKLPYLDSWNAIRAAHAAIYLELLRDIDGLDLPVVHPWAEPVWHVFAVRVRAASRAAFVRALAEQGIETSLHYPTPIHLQQCFERFGWGPGCFPVAERLANELVSLPLDPTHTPEEIAHVAEAVRHYFIPRKVPPLSVATVALDLMVLSG
jgi:dTDP-4-amino-4,6-dideoxygalactose transaminase